MESSPLTDLGSVINRYFAWVAAGPPWRFVLGLGGPILVVFLFFQLVSGGGDKPDQPAAAVPATAASRTLRPDQAATGSTTAGSPPVSVAGTPRGSATPQTTVPPGGTYVVKSGDTLGAVCAANVPSMSTNACVAAIVQLNKLANAGQLQVGQQLTLPGGTPAPAITPVVGTTAAGPTATPRP